MRFVHLRLLPLLLLLASAVVLVAAESKPRLAISCDHSDGVYAIGETIRWRIEPPAGDGAGITEATYALKRGGFKVTREGELRFTNGSATVETVISEPDALLLEVKARGSDGRTLRGLGGAVAAADKIQPSLPPPHDFDAFWALKLKELARVPADPQLTPMDSEKPGVDYWQITMNNIRGTHIRSQLARPKGSEKLPAMLVVQWAGVYGLPKIWATDRAAAGWLVLNINPHDLPVDKPAAFYEEQSKGPLKDYPGIGNDDRETSYFLRMYLSCYRGAQYLVERPDWDGKTLVVTGNSQGGMQTLMSAGFHPKITAAIAGVPAGCDLTGPQVGRAPGWPMWFWNRTGKNAAKVVEASRYYDVANFARHIKCPVLVGVGLIDETCPPAGIFATLNQPQGSKEIIILPRGDHMGTENSHRSFQERSNAWLDALRRGVSP